ncbi:hypothetical protein GH714_038917 [Hevea brasiliensis]|uniref:ArsA/GET3 Anion-transporting ATPase-like domain-containing protein n=2 Tax=Magnoliopsida TaxID=3398 RepID=A0A6A6MSE1_HEVBR|nr:hypothetical protein GH714_038917 [Hevea brasiliensis]
MHRESSPPNIYLRTSEQPNEELYKNSLALSDGSEVKTAQNSTNHVIKDPTRKAPILGILWLQVMEVDGDILAWKGSTENPNPFELASSLEGHTSVVICLTVGEKRLYSGSMDNTTRPATEGGNLEVIYTHNEEHGVIALCEMPDAEAKPILFCSCNDDSIYLYDLPLILSHPLMEVDPNVENEDVGGNDGMDSVFSELANAIPGIDEAMSFAEMLKLVQTMDYSVIVFDTAPTGHTLRLLQFPSTLEKGLQKMMSLKSKFGGLLSQMTRVFGIDDEFGEDALLGRLEGMKDVIERVNMQFKDPDLTTFVCVCIPEFLSLYETERLVQELTKFEIDTHNIIINQVLYDEEDVESKLLKARMRMQQKYMDQFYMLYDDFNITKLPLLPEEGLTWLLPERFSASEIGPEAVTAILGIITAINEHIIETTPTQWQAGFVEPFSFPYSLCISAVKDLETLVEVTAQHYYGEDKKWNFIAVTEALKVLVRLALFRNSGYKMLLHGGETPNTEKHSNLSSQQTVGGFSKHGNHHGPSHSRYINGRNPWNLEGRALSALSRFGENARMVSDRVWLGRVQHQHAIIEPPSPVVQRMTLATILSEKGFLTQATKSMHGGKGQPLHLTVSEMDEQKLLSLLLELRLVTLTCQDHETNLQEVSLVIFLNLLEMATIIQKQELEEDHETGNVDLRISGAGDAHPDKVDPTAKEVALKEEPDSEDRSPARLGVMPVAVHVPTAIRMPLAAAPPKELPRKTDTPKWRVGAEESECLQHVLLGSSS